MIIRKLFLLSALLLSAAVVFGSGQTEPSIEVTEDFMGNRNGETVVTAAIGRWQTIQEPFESRRDFIYDTAMSWAQNNPDYGIEIQLLTPGEISQDMSRILAEAQAGIGPDFIHVDSFWVGNFLDAGLLQPLDDLLPADELAEFYDFTRDVTVRDGRQYAIWPETDARFLYYRQDLIDTPPETWDELIEIAVAMNEEHGIHGYLTNAGQGEGASNENTWPYLWAQGGEIFDEENDFRPVLGEGENRDIMISIYSFMRRLVDSGASPEAIIGFPGFDPIMAEVRADNVAMMINGSWALGQLQDIVEDADEKWGFTSIPQRERGQRANSNGGWAWAILTDDPERQQVALSYIMENVAGAEAMAARSQVYGYIPTRRDVFEEDPFFSNDPIQQIFAAELVHGRARPATSLYPAISDLNARALGSVLTGSASPEEAVDRLQRQALAEWESWRQ